MFRKSSILLGVLLAGSIPLSGCSFISQATDKAKDFIPGNITDLIPGNITDIIPGQGIPSGSSGTGIVPAPLRGITGTVSVGPTVAAATVPVPSSGGKIAVTDTASPIAGLELNIPANSYPDAKQFKISYAPVQSHSFGEAFNPVTPLIRVDNGGAFAEDLMEIKVPVKIPADSFAMGFFYDDRTKKLEGMPTLAIDTTSITVGTQHFTDFLISMIPNTKLKPDIDSGFRPGIDDWEFVNNGSYIAQGGHCAGQSETAMWYYSVQPDGKDLTLYGRYDNNGDKPATPGFDYDDSLGYRFASMAQSDMKTTWGTQLFRDQRGVNDELAWKMFAYSIQITGEPQFVTMVSGKSGHAMICYRVVGGKLYIADPNYPGNTERWIDYNKANGTFTPYESGLNFEDIKNGNSIKFAKIGYAAKSAMVDWSKIDRHWTELKNKTIGNDKFPAYRIVWMDDKDQEHALNDGYVSPNKLIIIKVKSNTIATRFNVYRDGVALKWDARGNYELVPGNNKLGVHVMGEITVKDKNGNDIQTGSYVDFKYVNVISGEASPAAGLLPVLQQTKVFGANVSVLGKNTVSGPAYTKGPVSYDNPIQSPVQSNAITWSGTSFSGPLAGDGVKGTLSGTVSADGRTLTSLNVDYQWAIGTGSVKFSYILNNIPLKWVEPVSTAFFNRLDSQYIGAGLNAYVSKLEYTSQGISSGQPTTSVFGPPIWTDASNTLIVSFSKN